MELKLIGAEGNVESMVSVSDKVFDRPYNEALVHQVVTAYLANARRGTRAQKSRGEVARSTRKPWRQKGTGRARSGMAASPVWRGGGVTFPNSPNENFTQKVNRKMYRACLAVILSQLVREDRLAVVESMDVEQPKTRLLAQKVKDLRKGLDFSSLLLVTEGLSDELFLSSRNLPDMLVLETDQANPVSLLKFKQVLLTKPALAKMEELLS